MFIEEHQKDTIKKINETGRILVSEIQADYLAVAKRAIKYIENKVYWEVRCHIAVTAMITILSKW